jgi:iron complex outermembrane receptor protein
LITCLSLSQAAFSGETAVDAASGGAASDTDNGLGEIVVVARRREESLQNVPLTITAISGDTLQAASITQSTDLVRLIPTLNIQHGATGPGVQFSLRGIRAGVVAYFNEIPVGTNTQAVGDQLWDLSSIQALSGPQGTLFGRNSTGGAILFVPERPNDKLEGSIEQGFGNFNEKDVTAILNIPIGEILKIRLGEHYVSHDPMVDNLLDGGMNSEDRNAARVSILFEPTGNITNYTVLDLTKRDEMPQPLIASHVPATAGCFPGLGCLYGALPAQYGQLQDQLGIHTISSHYPSWERSKDYGVSNIFTFVGNDYVTLKYIVALRRSGYDQFSNLSSLDLPIELGHNLFPYDKEVINELQYFGKALGGRLNWTTGIYISEEKTQGGVSYSLFGNPALPFSDSRNIVNKSTTDTKSRAAYAQAMYGLTDKLNLTGGVRYTEDRPEIDAYALGPRFTFFGPQGCTLPATPGVDLTTCTRHLDAKSQAVTYNVSLDYHLSGSTLLYAATRRGYNGGGFNPSVVTTTTPGGPAPSYGPEHITDYEGGVKSDWLIADVPVRTNLSVFLANYSDIQRRSVGISDSGNPYTGVANGPKAQIYGLQFQSALRVTTGLTLILNYGYLHTEYKEGTRFFPKGNVFAQAPAHTLNLVANYAYPLPVGGDLDLSAGYTYQSKVTFADNNLGSMLIYQGGFGLVDARIGWKSVVGSNVDISVYGKNLTDKAYALERQDQTNFLGFLGTLYNDPRTYGVQVKYRFGK